MAGKSSTQEFVPIQEVREGIVILKGGGMRGILLCSSLNFALKAEDERIDVRFTALFQKYRDLLDIAVSFAEDLSQSKAQAGAGLP